MKRLIAALILVVAMAHGAFAQEPTPFAVGQVWALKTASPTMFTIMQIDEENGRRIVHGIPTGFAPVVVNGEQLKVSGAHMPFTEDAVRRSVDRLLVSNAPVPPSFRDAYAEWKSGKGGVFTITVQEAVASLGEATTKGRQGVRIDFKNAEFKTQKMVGIPALKLGSEGCEVQAPVLPEVTFAWTSE